MGDRKSKASAWSPLQKSPRHSSSWGVLWLAGGHNVFATFCYIQFGKTQSETADSLRVYRVWERERERLSTDPCSVAEVGDVVVGVSAVALRGVVGDSQMVKPGKEDEQPDDDDGDGTVRVLRGHKKQRGWGVRSESVWWGRFFSVLQKLGRNLIDFGCKSDPPPPPCLLTNIKRGPPALGAPRGVFRRSYFQLACQSDTNDLPPGEATRGRGAQEDVMTSSAWDLGPCKSYSRLTQKEREGRWVDDTGGSFLRHQMADLGTECPRPSRSCQLIEGDSFFSIFFYFFCKSWHKGFILFYLFMYAWAFNHMPWCAQLSWRRLTL